MSSLADPLRLLIVDDEIYFRQFLRRHLERKLGPSIKIMEASTPAEGVQQLQNHLIDLAIIDLNIVARIDGLELLTHLKEHHPTTRAIMLTEQQESTIIEQCYHLGADHYLVKEQCEAILHLLVQGLLNPLPRQLPQHLSSCDQRLLQEVAQLPHQLLHRQPLLLMGETGVGKGQLANLVRIMLGLEEDKFITLNLSAIADNLIESELFGHRKGAFTGAISDMPGKFELANHGLLFLDEIGSIPLTIQHKILKAIEEQSFYPVGSSQKVHSSFQLISATCEDLNSKMARGEFRSDLFYRINGITLTLPPLRERKDDIPLLIHHFLQQSPRKIILDPTALTTLMRYQWPGNIRELKSVVLNLLSSQKGIIQQSDLPPHIRENRPFGQAPTMVQPHHLESIQTIGLAAFLKEFEEECFRTVQLAQNGQIQKIKAFLQLHDSTYFRLAKRASARGHIPC